MREHVIYVDAAGRERNARTLEPAKRDGKTRLLVSYLSSGGLQVIEARYSAGGEPGTWHYPPKPS